MSVADEIKARLDLVAYISESVPLKKAGRNYKAPCPFHQERTPSFVVFPESQNWRCFGACGEGGDIFNFAMKQHGWDFREALENLAQKAGVELKPRTPEQAEREAEFDRLLGLLQETSDFFHQRLLHDDSAQDVRDYIARRGLTAQTVEDFQLGYAPDGWQNTLNHLEDLGYTQHDVIESGVAIRNDKGRVYDRFRHRLVIPIRDGRGRTIGFGARALRDEDNPKYLNSPQSVIFDKSKTLYGLDLARREIRETETAIIVEGYFDVIQAHQAGFRNVVAQMGTALTDPQLQVLRKYADRLILALDADQAGINATMRGLEVARESLDDARTTLFGRDGSMRRAGRLGIDMRVLVVTEGKDPDDLIRENPAEWQRLVADAEPVSDYVIRMGTAELDHSRASIHEREKIARRLLPLLTATESDLQKEANVQKLAYKLHLPERRLMEIARESRSAVARAQPTDARIHQRRPTRAMQDAERRFQRAKPPVAPPPSKPSKPLPAEGPRPDFDAVDLPPEFLEDEDFVPVDVLPGESQAVPDWEEGPRAAGDFIAPPDEDYDDEPSGPSAMPVMEVVRSAPAVVQQVPPAVMLQESYLLGMLIRRPDLLYQANRALREIAETSQNRFEDAGRKVKTLQALSSLEDADFRDTGHQMIFHALLESLDQDAMEPLEYVQAAVGEPFQAQLMALSTPVDAVSDALPEHLLREVRSIHKAMRKQGRVLMDPESEFVDKVFGLRKQRLWSENEVLRFVVAEASADEQSRLQDVYDANETAIFALERILYERAQIADS